MAERLLAGIRASGAVLHIRILDDSVWSGFVSSRTAEVDVTLCGWYLIYIAIVPICCEVLAISSRAYISDEIAVVTIAADIFPIEIFFVVDGVIFQKQINLLYREIRVLRYISPGLDIVFELDHPRIDIEYRCQ